MRPRHNLQPSVIVGLEAVRIDQRAAELEPRAAGGGGRPDSWFMPNVFVKTARVPDTV